MTARSVDEIRAAEGVSLPRNTVEVEHSVSLALPATLNELESFCETLEQSGVNGEAPVQVLPIDGHTVRLYVKIEKRNGHG